MPWTVQGPDASGSDNPKYFQRQQSTEVGQEMSNNGRGGTMHRPGDITLKCGQSLLKGQGTQTDTEAGKVTISWWLGSAFSFFPVPEDNGILGQVEFPRKLDSSHVNVTSVT